MTRVAAAANADGRTEVFYIRSDSALYHNWQTAPNGNWLAAGSPLPGFAKALAVGQNQDGRLELFHIGTNNALYHNWQGTPNGLWGAGGPLQGFGQAMAVGLNAGLPGLPGPQDGRLEVFYIGTDNALYHNWQTAPNGTSGWASQAALGGFAKALAVGENEDGRLEVFYIGTDNALYHNWQTLAGGWSGEVRLGGVRKR